MERDFRSFAVLSHQSSIELVEIAVLRILLDLLIPRIRSARVDPACQLLELLGRKFCDGGFDFEDRAHSRSLHILQLVKSLDVSAALLNKP